MTKEKTSVYIPYILKNMIMDAVSQYDLKAHHRKVSNDNHLIFQTRVVFRQDVSGISRGEHVHLFDLIAKLSPVKLATIYAGLFKITDINAVVELYNIITKTIHEFMRTDLYLRCDDGINDNGVLHYGIKVTTKGIKLIVVEDRLVKYISGYTMLSDEDVISTYRGFAINAELLLNLSRNGAIHHTLNPTTRVPLHWPDIMALPLGVEEVPEFEESWIPVLEEEMQNLNLKTLADTRNSLSDYLEANKPRKPEIVDNFAGMSFDKKETE